MNRTIGIITANYEVAGFGELTRRRPPASLPFCGRYRLMDFALSNMVNSGIDTVGLITPHYYRSVLDHVGAGKCWGLDRKEGGLFILPGTVYGIRESQSARLLFRDLINNRSFLDKSTEDYVLLTSSTLIYNVDYRPMIGEHELSGRSVTMLYKKMPAGQQREGCCLELDPNGGVTGMRFGEKGENLFLDALIINWSDLNRMLCDFKALGVHDLLSVISKCLKDLSVGSYAYDGYVGFSNGIEDYMASSWDMLDPELRRQVFRPDRQIRTRIHDTPPALYQPGSDVRNCVMAAGSIVEGKAESSILFRNVRIRPEAQVKNCVIMDGSIIGEGARLENVVCDRGVTVSAGLEIRGTPKHPCIIPKDSVV